MAKSSCFLSRKENPNKGVDTLYESVCFIYIYIYRFVEKFTNLVNHDRSSPNENCIWVYSKCNNDRIIYRLFEIGYCSDTMQFIKCSYPSKGVFYARI